jgi:hypothetical protein
MDKKDHAKKRDESWRKGEGEMFGIVVSEG